MIANVNPRGHSFRGVTAYLLHDKGAETSERVMWSSTHNLHTDDVEKASRFMAWTDQNRDALRVQAGGSAAGRKASAGNVYHYSLSWKPGSAIERQQAEETARATVERLGLGEHQYYLVMHGDTEHAHVHVVANLVHPETGKIASVWRDQKRLDRWANEYEQVHGIECERRARKYEAWDRDAPAFGAKEQRAERSQLVSEAFHRSDSGKAFRAALEGEGLHLARGTRRALVVVDQNGDIFALNRLISLADGTQGRAKSKAISARLQDIDPESLEQADQLAARLGSFDRDAEEVARQKALADASEKAAKERTAAAQKLSQERARRAREAGRQADLREQKAHWKALQREVARKTAASRQRWQIDALTKKRDQAKAELEALGGFWARIFKRRQISRAKDHLQAAELTLEERLGRFEADVQAFSRLRPAWFKGREETRPERSQKVPDPTPLPSPTKEVMSAEERKAAEKKAFLERAMRRSREARRQERGRGRDPGLERE